MSKAYIIGAKVSFALLGLSAVVTEIATLVERGFFVPVNFFSYFTVLSNIFAVIALLLGAFALATGTNSVAVHLVRGAAALYMTMTGIVFAVLLAGIEGSVLTAVPWDNIVLHYIMPIVMLLDWVVDRPSSGVPYDKAVLWLIFPLVYVVYSLVRGAVTGWYPYPFLDVSANGAVSVAVTSVCIAILAALIGTGLVISTRKRT